MTVANELLLGDVKEGTELPVIHRRILKTGREIWTIGNRTDLRYRVLVLSADNHNERTNASPFCAPIVRQRGATQLPPYAVALTEQDPITGVVVVNRMRRLPASIGGVMVIGVRTLLASCRPALHETNIGPACTV